MKNKYTRIGQSVKITLTFKKEKHYCFIDAADLPKVYGFKHWRLLKGRCGLHYVAASNWENPKTLTMLHRLIADTPDDRETSFLNKNPLDCRRHNLINGNHHQTMKGKQAKHPTQSGEQNITINAKTYGVQLFRDGKRHFQSFKTLPEAIKWRDEMRQKFKLPSL